MPGGAGIDRFLKRGRSPEIRGELFEPCHVTDIFSNGLEQIGIPVFVKPANPFGMIDFGILSGQEQPQVQRIFFDCQAGIDFAGESVRLVKEVCFRQILKRPVGDAGFRMPAWHGPGRMCRAWWLLQETGLKRPGLSGR